MIPSGATFGGKHTLTYFGMYPKSKIVFLPPSVKTTYVDVPESNGILDYTGLLTGDIHYSNRRGTLEFIALTTTDYLSVYSGVLNYFHGQEMAVVLDDDPLFFYKGRFFVNKWKSIEGKSTIAIDYDLEPYKYPLANSTGAMDWLWNDLFSNTIYYGTFKVSGTKERNLINPSGIALTPKFTCSAPMSVSFNNGTYSLPQGTTTTPGFQLSAGNNRMTFSGNGTVLADYIMNAVL